MTIQEIRHAFSGRLMGGLKMRTAVCETLLLLPEDIVKYVTRNVWFISSPDDAWAFTFRGSEIAKRHLVVLTEELFSQAPEDINYTIVHEIGHVMLNHKNSIGVEQTQTEINKQEKEADEFARRYLG
ncbi:ImmA/IrrE family metallo-endopeptidase [Candidatus Woesebacteria bacterium]|nr:ImmA/IrrE family metallo-endopeptidase [Candidatus Woesebacteria bacterium]